MKPQVCDEVTSTSRFPNRMELPVYYAKGKIWTMSYVKDNISLNKRLGTCLILGEKKRLKIGEHSMEETVITVLFYVTS